MYVPIVYPTTQSGALSIRGERRASYAGPSEPAPRGIAPISIPAADNDGDAAPAPCRKVAHRLTSQYTGIDQQHKVKMGRHVHCRRYGRRMAPHEGLDMLSDKRPNQRSVCSRFSLWVGRIYNPSISGIPPARISPPLAPMIAMKHENHSAIPTRARRRRSPVSRDSHDGKRIIRAGVG